MPNSLNLKVRSRSTLAELPLETGDWKQSDLLQKIDDHTVYAREDSD